MTRDERRAAMPECTAFIDDFRDAFGMENIAHIKATENGHTVEWGDRTLIGAGVRVSDMEAA